MICIRIDLHFRLMWFSLILSMLHSLNVSLQSCLYALNGHFVTECTLALFNEPTVRQPKSTSSCFLSAEKHDIIGCHHRNCLLVAYQKITSFIFYYKENVGLLNSIFIFSILKHRFSIKISIKNVPFIIRERLK